jgi:hypothetical protein
MHWGFGSETSTKRPPARPRIRWKDNINMGFKGTGCMAEFMWLRAKW